jgi:hypothetical protein
VGRSDDQVQVKVRDDVRRGHRSVANIVEEARFRPLPSGGRKNSEGRELNRTRAVLPPSINRERPRCLGQSKTSTSSATPTSMK